MKSIGLALAQYAVDNQKFYPSSNGIEGLKLLFDNNYLGDLKILRSPVDKTAPSLDTSYVSYIYIGKDIQYSISNSNSPILLDKYENHKNAGHVLYADGKVKLIEGRDWKKMANPKGTK